MALKAAELLFTAMHSLRLYFSRFGDFQKSARLFIYLTFILGVSQSAFGLVYNLYILKLGYTREFVGTLESIPMFVTAALAAPLALLCAGLPLKKNLAISLCLAAASALGLAVFPSRAMLISFKFVSGFSGAFMAITSWPLMARYSTEKDRNFVFSFQFAFSTLAGFLGNLLGGALTDRAAALLSGGAESAAAYRITLLAATALMAAALLPVFYFEDAAPAPKRPARGLNLDLGGIKPLEAFMVFLPQTLVGFGAGMIMPYLNIFFKTGFDLQISSLGFYMSLMPLSMAAGGFIGPWLVRKKGQVRAMIILQSLSIPFLATMGFSGQILPTITAAFIRTMLMNAGGPIYGVFMLSRFKKEAHALASAVYTACWSLLWAFGAKLSGKLQMDFGFNMSFLITIICYSAATLVLSRRFLREDEQKTPPPVGGLLKEEME
ncbi:MAG: MFS transporter [Elusimicrobiales bacterium]|jgi:MFS family permease